MRQQKKKIEDLIPHEALKKLIENHEKSIGTEGGVDHVPVLKLYVLECAFKWLLTELDIETNIAFGLCDLGCPEMGYVSIDELLDPNLNVSLLVDAGFKPLYKLSQYAGAARAAGMITV